MQCRTFRILGLAALTMAVGAFAYRSAQPTAPFLPTVTITTRDFA